MIIIQEELLDTSPFQSKLLRVKGEENNIKHSPTDTKAVHNLAFSDKFKYATRQKKNHLTTKLNIKRKRREENTFIPCK